jgi:5'-nucleotidase
MLLSRIPLALASFGCLQGALGLNILLNNDDSWVSANIRAFYYALKAAGHNVLLVAPAVNQSGRGGTVGYPDS